MKLDSIDCAEIASEVLDYLAAQNYQNEPILHAIIVCDYVSRQHMIAALTKIIEKYATEG